MARRADHGAVAWALGAVAFAVAAAGAKPVAQSWNDGSRLASVAALVERGGFCVDGSVFLDPARAPGPSPYPSDDALLQRGTQDKLLIDGHYYSDKPPLVSVPLAAAYRGLMAVGVPGPRDRPDVFAWVVCALLSGTGYAVAVGCMWTLGKRAGLDPRWRLAWLGAFALGSVLPAYTRSANSHVAQLGAVAAVCVLLCRVADRAAVGRTAWAAVVGAGAVVGFAYNLDFGLGPPLVAAVLAAVAVRTRRAVPVLTCAAAALPCVLAGHAINAAVGGDWVRPLNMHPEYLAWPGSPFTTTMTGVIRPHPVPQALYALDLLFGKKGFLTHNPPLLLAVTAGAAALARTGRDRPELLALTGWCAAGWLLYGALSKNHGGMCVSIRWFVPFLVPGFWVLARLLAERPQFRPDFVALAVWGAVLSASAWSVGPWWGRNVPLYWWVFGGSLLTWGIVRRAAARKPPDPPAVAYLTPAAPSARAA
jgi:hypothetical protein